MNFDTIAIHGGYDPNDNAKSMAVPIYQTSAYLFENTQHAVDLFNLDEQGDIYTRISNPTTNILETRMAMLEGGVGALATASGHSATLIACLNILNPGDEIISSAALYGGTYTLFSSTFKKFGIKVKFVDNEEPESYEKAITDKTKLVFAEIIGNPNLNVPDIEKIAVIAHKNKIPFMLDNTFATPYLFKPFDYGVDIIVYSATKYLCGHGTSIGGLIVDSGKFNWNESDKFPELTASGEFSQGLNYTEKFGNAAYIVKARAQMLRDFGPSISPFNSFLILQGLETLALRMQRHSESALKIAQFLKNHKNVSWVNYPGLETDDSHEKAQKYLKKGQSGIISFGIKGGKNGGKQAGKTFIESVKLLSHVANLGDVRSLVVHPASTTHSQLSEEDKLKTGVTDDFIRLSIGIEDVNDIITDIDQALECSQKG